ncbi:MAG: VWA domain-containing protein [Acidobacteriota bacterium]
MPETCRNQKPLLDLIELVARRGTVLLLALACVLTARSASSQEDTSGSFGESVDVVVVEVETVVTDRRGNRVAGLEPEDFRLVVDGEEVPIDYFTEVRDGRAAPPAAEGREPGVPSGSGSGSASGPSGAHPVATNYLVFIDDYFGIGSRRNWMLERMLARLDELPPQDRMAVVAFDGEGIEVLTEWSDSRDQARAALAAAMERPAKGLLRADEFQRRSIDRVAGPFAANWAWAGSRTALAPVGTAASTPDPGPPTSYTVASLERIGRADSRLRDPFHDVWVQDLELHRVLTAIRSTMRLVPRPEGRNVLFLLAGGWPTGPDDQPVLWAHEDDTLLSLPQGYGRYAPLDDLQMILPVIDTANLLGYTIYAADVEGFRPAPGGNQSFRVGTLRELSAATGGRALLFDQRAESFEAVVADTRTYYSLGFTPELERDNEYHDIRVEVRRPGLDVRARAGYRDFVMDTELDLLAESALQFGGGDAGAAGEEILAVSLGEAQRRPRRTMKVPLTVDIPWSRVTVLPTAEGRTGSLEIRVAARDRSGALSEVATVPLRIRVPEGVSPEGSLTWENELILRRERNELVVSVYDAHSGQVLTRVVTAEP